MRLELGTFPVTEIAFGPGIHGALHDQLGRGENPVRDPSGREERHHLPVLDIGDEGVGEAAFERVPDLEPDALAAGIDQQQQSAPAIPLPADAKLGKVLDRRAFDVAGIANRRNAIVDPVILREQAVELGDAVPFRLGQEVGFILHQLRLAAGRR